MRDPSGSTFGSAATIPFRVCAPDAVFPSIEYAVAEKVCTSVGASGFAIIGGAGSGCGFDFAHPTASKQPITRTHTNRMPPA